MYWTGTVMKKRSESGASKRGDDKSFKRGKWQETVRVD
jgi:hypothetical protein